jgi:DNA integrity scanning protein DisA with diadenylate cyclase activity
MHLTRVFIEAILAVAVLTGVIVFQDDIRRFLDAMGAWRVGRRFGRAPSVSSVWIDDLVSASEDLADSRTGALIAVRGRESWDRVRGGIALDGAISVPLLMSIFDHHSAGHDGAVLVEEDRIARFAAHLPLSSNQDAVGSRGTRHAAAVGLSENCDALLIVISEETGTLSVAERGVLNPVDSAAELRARLEHFRARHEDRRSKPWKALWTHHSMQNGALAVIGSLCLWLFFAFQPVPIELRLSEGMTLVQSGDTEARVTLQGTARAFELLNENELVAVVDLSDLTAGAHVVELTQDHLKLPGAISLSGIEPRRIRVSTRTQATEPAAIDE